MLESEPCELPDPGPDSEVPELAKPMSAAGKLSRPPGRHQAMAARHPDFPRATSAGYADWTRRTSGEETEGPARTQLGCFRCALLFRGCAPGPSARTLKCMAGDARHWCRTGSHTLTT